MSFITSAPGKVIIFGEHSAVYNEPAVAASVSSLRSYLLVEAIEGSDSIVLNFPDIGFHQEWKHSEFDPILNNAEYSSLLESARKDTRNLDETLVRLLEVSLLSSLKETLHYHAALCFLYLYVCMCPDVKGIDFSVKSTLPIGAGLGSSASISVVLALAMAKLGGAIKVIDGLSVDDKKLINTWSFIGEKCIHGTPSGIDNAVATYGNAVLFKREEDGSTNFEFIQDFPQIPMILSHTKIPRSTKTLVGNVRALLNTYPAIIQPIISSMGSLATEGANILNNLNESNYSDLLELVRINHGQLVSLGVSHPSLETIKSLSDSMDIGSTKLTGAGGGGCSLSILKKDIKREQIDEFKKTLESQHNFGTYETDLGGMGCSAAFLENFSEDDIKEITEIFGKKDVTRKQIDDLFLSKNSKLSWIY